MNVLIDSLQRALDVLSRPMFVPWCACGHHVSIHDLNGEGRRPCPACACEDFQEDAR